MSWPDPGSWTPRSPQNPQPRRAGRHAPPRGKARHTAQGTAVRGDAREGTRGSGRVVVEVAGDHGVPGPGGGGPVAGGVVRGGVRRQCEAVSEERLASRLEKVTDRLAADAGNMERSGTELIGYFLSP
jgi:hypothetical protein